MILGLQTSLGAYGGIPRYNRTVCHALNQSVDSLGAIERRVLIALDHPAEVKDAARAMSDLEIETFSGSRFGFVGRALGIALRNRIDLLLIGHVNYAPLGPILRRLSPNLRYGVFVYGVDAWDRLTVTRRRALKQANFVISISEYTKQKMIEVNGICGDSTHVVPPSLEYDCESVDLPPAPMVANRIPEARDINLLSVCRLDASERYKGVDTVIQSLPAILERVPNLRYVVVGTGDDVERHRQLAEKTGVADRVCFLGAVDESRLRQCYASCDIFVLPSSSEGFGIVYLEAMHLSKPVIAANSGAAPEVVKNSKTGLLVEYGNVSQLAEAVVRLCQRPDHRAALGNAGHQHLQANYTFPAFKRRMNEILAREMPRRKPSRSLSTDVDC